MDRFGLQLYTVRRVVSDDTIEAVMQEIKSLGYTYLFWKGIIDSAKASGVKYFVVEQDKCDNSPLDSIKYSAEYLLTL